LAKTSKSFALERVLNGIPQQMPLGGRRKRPRPSATLNQDVFGQGVEREDARIEAPGEPVSRQLHSDGRRSTGRGGDPKRAADRGRPWAQLGTVAIEQSVGFAGPRWSGLNYDDLWH
jgi:hypothetical protein